MQPNDIDNSSIIFTDNRNTTKLIIFSKSNRRSQLEHIRV